jgi:TPR repeat protein
MYWEGKGGLTSDEGQARHYFHLAGQQGDGEANDFALWNFVGDAGNGCVDKDAFKSWRKAQEHGQFASLLSVPVA